MQGTHRANMEIPNASRIPHPGTPQSLQRGNSPHPVQIHPADDHTFFCPTSVGIRYSRLSPCMFNGWIGMTVRHGTHTLRSYSPKDPPSTKTNRCIHSKLSTSTPQSLHSHTVQNIGARERSRTPHRTPVEGSNAAKEQIVRHLRLRNLW